MRNFFIRWVVNVIALYIAANLVPGIAVPEKLGSLALVVLIFGFVNACIGPLLKFLTCPLILLTLGLFTLVVNGVLLWLSSWIAGLLGIPFHVQGFWAAFLGALVISVVSWVMNLLLKDDRSDRKR